MPDVKKPAANIPSGGVAADVVGGDDMPMSDPNMRSKQSGTISPDDGFQESVSTFTGGSVGQSLAATQDMSIAQGKARDSVKRLEDENARAMDASRAGAAAQA
jgi:hypothetical protein